MEQSAADTEKLLKLLGESRPQFLAQQGTRDAILRLAASKASALRNLVQMELSSQTLFDTRDRRLTDFDQFDWELNGLASSILASSLGIQELADPGKSGRFARNPDLEASELAELARHGYATSRQVLPAKGIQECLSALGDFVFRGEGLTPTELSGRELLDIGAGYDQHKRRLKGADTFWISDINGPCHKREFEEIAFDPYILSIVGRYLGCCPIHVQTNLWFSFPTSLNKANLSRNAQMFHQDKDYIKFIKVFIYLTDVSEQSGPHCYIEGTHRDELHKHGVPFSERVPDARIGSYYREDRIRTVTGKAGMITFGDTSCVHKGLPVTQGHRIMLQLEYASSLYRSPVSPFEDISPNCLAAQRYSAAVAKRLTQNYSSENRKRFKAYADSTVPRATFLRRLGRAGKNVLKKYLS